MTCGTIILHSYIYINNTLYRSSKHNIFKSILNVFEGGFQYGLCTKFKYVCTFSQSVSWSSLYDYIDVSIV